MSSKVKKRSLKGGVLMEPMLYTVKEVAQILKCNPTRVYGLKDAGLLPFLKLGQLKCRREAVEEFLRKYEGYDVSDPNNIIPLEQGEEVKP
jgi:excisionase family DNA binding protein